MKVLMITNLCLGNAATLSERSLFTGLVKKGVDLTVISHWPTDESKEVEAAGIKVIYMPILKKIHFPTVRKLRKIFTEEKTDIVYMTFSKAITNGLIAARGTNVKIVGYLGSLSLYWHDPFAYLTFLNRRVDKVICESNGILDHAIKQNRKRLEKKLVRIYKGFDPSWTGGFTPKSRKDLNIPDDALVVGCVANFRRVKGIPYLIKSADHLQTGLPVYYLLVGPGMDSAKVRRQTEKTPYRDNFRTVGFTNEVFSYVDLCDLYVQPSLSEGFGRSILEAMSLEKPVIVTEVGGAKELVIEGSNGYVVPIKSAKAIAEKIALCLKNKSTLPEMGSRSKMRIINEFSPQAMTDQNYELFLELAGTLPLVIFV
jgi:L-malate glycosyltransferase